MQVKKGDPNRAATGGAMIMIRIGGNHPQYMPQQVRCQSPRLSSRLGRSIFSGHYLQEAGHAQANS